MNDVYQSPLGLRYASQEMTHLFSNQHRHSTWRRLWIALAEAQKDLGLNISAEQIRELKEHVDNIDFEKVACYEKEFRHDVMAHIHAYGDLCPQARPIIHLGATSCLITDNSDLIIYRDALIILRNKLLSVLSLLSSAAQKYKDLPTLSYTHFQTAQPTTVGKRISLWLQDFLLDFHDLQHRLEKLRPLGIRGATGTQASFLSLFEGDHQKVKDLETLVCERFQLNLPFAVSGQTYTRKQDAQILETLSSIATSAHKMCSDFRLLAHLKEMEEPFAKSQVGSSAMPYKRNPMQSERICSLARFVLSLSENPKYTAATQWLERSLDDSANRRLCMPEAFLTCDSILQLLIHLSGNFVVHPKVIENNLNRELPFLATENILCASVKKGKDRQSIHERIRQQCIESSQRMKEEGKDNDLVQRMTQDDTIPFDEQELAALMLPKNFIGRAPEQVEEFICKEVSPLLKKFSSVDIAKLSKVEMKN